MSGPLSRAGPGAPAVGDWRVQWKSWEGLQWGRDFLSSPFQPPSPPPPSPGPRARRRAGGGGAEGPAAVRAGPAGPGVLAGVPHAPSPCVAEEDGQPRVPRRPGLRGRRPVDVLQLLQVQPAGPRGGGHGPEAAGTPRHPGARGSWGDRGIPGRAALGGTEASRGVQLGRPREPRPRNVLLSAVAGCQLGPSLLPGDLVTDGPRWLPGAAGSGGAWAQGKDLGQRGREGAVRSPAALWWKVPARVCAGGAAGAAARGRAHQ